MSSLRLRLLALGARTMIRPWFRYSRNPLRDAARLDRMMVLTGRYVAGTRRTDDKLGGRPALWVQGPLADADSVILYFHGGGYFAGSRRTHGPMMSRLAALAAIAVVLPDYRLAPEAAFPAAYIDALAAWDDLRARGYAPGRIILGGDSAGGGLMLSLLATLCQRGERPAGAFAMSPWTDLTCSGGTMTTHAALDAALPADRIKEAAAGYLGGAAADDPRASPLFADFPDPPPVLLQIGDPEILEDDALRMADRLHAAGGAVTLRKWDGAPHVFHLGAAWVPEARAALRDIAVFVQTSLASASR